MALSQCGASVSPGSHKTELVVCLWVNGGNVGLVSDGLGTELTRFGQNMLIHDSALFVETKHTFKGLK